MNSVSYHNILTNLNRFSMKVSTTRAPNNSRASRKHSLKDQRSSPMDLMLWGNSRSFIWTEKEGRQQEEVRHWKRKNKYWATPHGLTVHPSYGITQSLDESPQARTPSSLELMPLPSYWAGFLLSTCELFPSEQLTKTTVSLKRMVPKKKCILKNTS